MIDTKVIDSKYVVDGEEKDFSYYTDIDMNKKLRFVNAVTDYVINEKSNNYYSVMRDMFFDFEIIEMFTDIDLTDYYSSDNAVNDIEKLVDENKDVLAEIKSNLAEGVFESLSNNVDYNLAFRTGIHKDTLASSLSQFIGVLEAKLNTVDFNNLTEMSEKLNEVADKITPEKIVDAYGNSKLYKGKPKKYNNGYKKNYNKNYKKKPKDNEDK